MKVQMRSGEMREKDETSEYTGGKRRDCRT